MEINVSEPTTSDNSSLEQYEQFPDYRTSPYQVLDEGVAPSTSSQKNVAEPQVFFPEDRCEQLNSTWTMPKALSARRLKSKLFRSPSPRLQKAILSSGEVADQAFIDETSRAVSSVKEQIVEESNREERIARINYRQPYPQIECQPSTSREPERLQGNRPLSRLTLQIGKKVLRFKVAQANPITPAPIMQNAPTSEKLRCATCRLMFKSQEDLQKHNKNLNCSSSKTFVCIFCGIGFTNKASLTAHHKVHNGPKSHECNICHKAFSRASNLEQHLKFHQAGKHHFCEMCGRCFKDADQMLVHQANCINLMNGEYVNLDKPMRYQCSYCEKVFHHKRDKFIHERVHTGEKPYECGYCGRSFSQSQTLTIHIRDHTGERPFNCSYCPKQFKDSSALRKHEFRFHVSTDFADYEEPSKVQGIGEYGSSTWK